MSLVENLARRPQMSLELVGQIGVLKERGYTSAEIAAKIDMTPGICQGDRPAAGMREERLICAVEKGQVPINTAVAEISAASDEEAQRALLEAYEKKELRGKALTTVRRLIEQRQVKGKTLHLGVLPQRKAALTSNMLVRTYRQEVKRQTMLIKKAKLCEARLIFIVSALAELFQDENFTTLLRAQAIDSMPKYLAEQINEKNSRVDHDSSR